MKGVFGDAGDERIRRRALVFGQSRLMVLRIGHGIGAVDIDLDRLDRTDLHEAADHRVADFGEKGEFADDPLAFADPLERLLALRREAGRLGAGRAIFDRGARALQCRGRGQRHAQYGGGRREVIIGRPLDQPAERRAERGDVGDREEVAQAVVADLRIRRHPVRLPHHAEQLARAQRYDDDRARLDLHAGRHTVIERPEGSVEDQDTGARRHGALIWG